MLEIAKSVSCNAKIIILDEPTSSLTEREVEHLFTILRKLTARGCGVVYISHKMEEILQISDYVTVMRDGKLISYGLVYLSVNPYLQYIIKGAIILFAVSIDTQKYISKK